MLIISPLYHFTSNIRVFSAIGLRVSLDVTHLLMCSMLMSASILCTLHLVYCFDGLFNNKMASFAMRWIKFWLHANSWESHNANHKPLAVISPPNLGCVVLFAFVSVWMPFHGFVRVFTICG